METVKALVKYIDAYGRMVVLTYDNQALIINRDQLVNGAKYHDGDCIVLERKEGLKRSTDWRVKK